jgi:hypothetical protein
MGQDFASRELGFHARDRASRVFDYLAARAPAEEGGD